MTFTYKFVTTFLTTLAVLFITNMVFPNYLVFGTLTISSFQALLTSAFGVALGASVIKPILHDDFGFNFSDKGWMVIYLLVNMGALYLMARAPLSHSIGMGIVGFWMSIFLGLIITVVQYFVLMDALHPKKMKK